MASIMLNGILLSEGDAVQTSNYLGLFTGEISPDGKEIVIYCKQYYSIWVPISSVTRRHNLCLDDGLWANGVRFQFDWPIHKLPNIFLPEAVR